eukprot:9467338-Pyramimonas_sp.AAC.1
MAARAASAAPPLLGGKDPPRVADSVTRVRKFIRKLVAAGTDKAYAVNLFRRLRRAKQGSKGTKSLSKISLTSKRGTQFPMMLE